jgi:hypothetical protein
MSRLMSRQFRHRFGLVGLLTAVVAMVSQLTLGAMVLPDDEPADPIVALNAVSVLCQAGQPVGDKHSPAHRAPQAALCPLSVTLALPAAILAPATLLPAPPAVLALRIALPSPARAPPSLRSIAAYPRGPPILL